MVLNKWLIYQCKNKGFDVYVIRKPSLLFSSYSRNMGRRQYLTVRKRRCNERQVLKKRKEEKLLEKTQRVYGMRDPILPSNHVVSKSSGIPNCEDVSQSSTEHENNEECDTQPEIDEEGDTQPEMMECKESSTEVNSCHEVVAMSSLVDHSSFDDTIADSVDTTNFDIDPTNLDIEPLNPDIITYPDPLNWTFSKEDVSNTSFINFDTIGMETEFLSSEIQCEALQHLRFSCRVLSYLLNGLFCHQTNIVFSFVL